MTQKEFDRILMEEMGQLPPTTDIVADSTPWQNAMTSIMWGMALNVFKFNFFYLQYILPLLGAVLMYLGYRSLRRENKPFRLCYFISTYLLIRHALFDVLAATPILGRLADSPLNYPLAFLGNGLYLILLLALRMGIQQAFAKEGADQGTDWLHRGIIARLLSTAIAVSSELIPLTQPAPMFGPQIIDGLEWLYYGRSAAFIALEIYLLVCISRQTAALAGHGYTITPSPVKCSGRAVVLGVFAAVLVCIPPAAYLGSHVPMAQAQPLTQTLTQAQQQTKEELVALGLPRGLADILAPEELDLCARASAVYQPLYVNYHSDGEVVEGSNLDTQSLEEVEFRLSAWMVQLPNHQVRQYYWLEYTLLPQVRLQEQFNADPSGNYPQSDFSARLVWSDGETAYAAVPELRLAGGQTEADIDEMGWSAVMFPESVKKELERLGGRLHWIPWFNFTIPKAAQTMEGYLAYSTDFQQYFTLPHQDGLYDFAYYTLRRQTGFLHYPFSDISDLGGVIGRHRYGPITGTYGLSHFLLN